MDNLNDESESEKYRNPNDKCILLFTCSYCGKKINTIKNNNTEKPLYEKESFYFIPNMANDYICTGCNKPYLKKCSVCLCPIKLNKINSETIVFCIKCSHGGHYPHYKEWFREMNECPNPKCDCLCQIEGNIN